ncbi:MAG: cytochrome P460 family protein [Alphaproteobacteria bacterium]
MELTFDEATAAYACIKGILKRGYFKSAQAASTGSHHARYQDYQEWARYSTRPYVSATHGGRFVQNYANVVAKAYGKYEDAGRMPVGAILAKDSFLVQNGRVAPGPLFVMEKMRAGFNEASGNWRYTLVMADGRVVGTTNGEGSQNVAFCAGCHMGLTGEETDSLFFLPDEYRVQ